MLVVFPVKKKLMDDLWIEEVDIEAVMKFDNENMEEYAQQLGKLIIVNFFFWANTRSWVLGGGTPRLS